MIFRKKKRMVDIRELQKRGVVRIPKKDIVIPTDRDGFVEVGNETLPTANTTSTDKSKSSNTNFFGFIDSSSSNTNSGRDESQRITDLDNKIYKLEQRIELLEKKLDINQASNSSVSAMGW